MNLKLPDGFSKSPRHWKTKKKCKCGETLFLTRVNFKLLCKNCNEYSEVEGNVTDLLPTQYKKRLRPIFEHDNSQSIKGMAKESDY